MLSPYKVITVAHTSSNKSPRATLYYITLYYLHKSNLQRRCFFFFCQERRHRSLDKTAHTFCFRNDESLCSCCWSTVLTITRGWRRALFYLPLSCTLAWKPHSLLLSYVAGKLGKPNV